MVKRFIKKIYLRNTFKKKQIKIKRNVNIDLNSKFEGNNVINKNKQKLIDKTNVEYIWKSVKA